MGSWRGVNGALELAGLSPGLGFCPLFSQRRPAQVSKGLDVSSELWAVGSSPALPAARLAAQTLWPRWAPPSRCLSVPLTWLFITMGFCKAPVNHLHSEAKTGQGRRMQLTGSSAQLSFPSRQPSPKITSSGSIHLEQKGSSRPDPVAFASQRTRLSGPSELQGLAPAQAVSGAGRG